jgi:spore germination protein YaaH
MPHVDTPGTPSDAGASAAVATSDGAVTIDTPDAAALPDAAPPMTPPLKLSGLLIQPTSNGAKVTFTSSAAATGAVDYGATTAYGASVKDAGGTQHTVTVGGLKPSTAYHLRARISDPAGQTALSSDQPFTTAPAPHRFCGWTLATDAVPPSQDPGYSTFAAHASDFDAIHPVWWHVTTPTTFASIDFVDDPTITSHTTVAGASTLLIPTLAAVDGTDPASVSTMLHDSSLEAMHVAAIVALATSRNYDGIDLDYEHLPTGDKPAFTAFVGDLATALHAKGKTLSVAVNALRATSGPSVYDYDGLSAAADQLHIMGYDFHSLGQHLGPVAPLGWVQDVVAYAAGIANGTRKAKFILGLPNYGLAGPDGGSSNWFGTLKDAIALSPGYATTTTHMLTCPFVDPSHPIAAGRAPNALGSKGRMFFDDISSLEEKVVAAQNAGLGGITYWTIGGEPDAPGPLTFFQMVRSHFPK